MVYSEFPPEKPKLLTSLVVQDGAICDKTRQDKTTLFSQDGPISCKAGSLRGPGFYGTYIYTFTIKLQG